MQKKNPPNGVKFSAIFPPSKISAIFRVDILNKICIKRLKMGVFCIKNK